MSDESKQRTGERVHGPYKHGNRWRVVLVRADGVQSAESFESKAAASRFANAARAESAGRTVTRVLDTYEVSLRERGLAGTTITRARYHLDRLLQADTEGHRPLTWLTPVRADELYIASRAGVSVDTHRNGLAVAKTHAYPVNTPNVI